MSGDNQHLREVAITHPQKEFLLFVARRQGEIPWDWSKCVRPDARALVVSLINKQLLREREYVTSTETRLYMRLTDQGRALCAHLEKLHARAEESAAKAAEASAAKVSEAKVNEA